MSNSKMSLQFVRSLGVILDATQSSPEPVSNKNRNANKRVTLKGTELAISKPVTSDGIFNEQGYEINDPVKYPFNYRVGFGTIFDFWTAFHNNNTGLAMVVRQSNMTAGKGKLISADKLYAHHEHAETFDVSTLIEMLTSEGFVSGGFPNDQLLFVSFDKRNLPTGYVTIRADEKMRRQMEIIDGVVSQHLYKKIEALVMPQLVAKENDISLSHLTGYKMVEGQFAGGITETQHLLSNMDYSLNCFYPWITVDINTYLEDFMASRSNVLILIGPPGTGKSTLIRTMIRDLNLRALLAYKPEVISSTHFITTCQSFLKSDKSEDDDANPVRSVIVVEDADILMAARNKGNLRMGEILNATSGIASDTQSKFILSTNLNDVEEIDAALLRPGRCFDILCFRSLTAAEATTVREMRGLPPREFNPAQKYKLASVLNDSRTEPNADLVVKPRFGFNTK